MTSRERNLSGLSELEGVVLGIMQRMQPCTAYTIRMELQASPSSYWSASAGAIYPLLRRLERSGLVSGQADPGDRRGRRLLRLTPAGRDLHRDWMLSGTSIEVASAISDTVRSRTFFLGSLAEDDRLQFVTESVQTLEAFLHVAKRDLDERAESEDPWSRLAALGAVYQAEARLAWMREVRRQVAGET